MYVTTGPPIVFPWDRLKLLRGTPKSTCLKPSSYTMKDLYDQCMLRICWLGGPMSVSCMAVLYRGAIHPSEYCSLYDPLSHFLANLQSLTPESFTIHRKPPGHTFLTIPTIIVTYGMKSQSRHIGSLLGPVGFSWF